MTATEAAATSTRLVRAARAQAYDPEARRRLWELSQELTGIREPL
jgi:hypothetical protein